MPFAELLISVLKPRLPLVGVGHAGLSRIAGACWHLISDAEREFWQRVARAALDEHKRTYPGYRFVPTKDKSSAKLGKPTHTFVTSIAVPCENGTVAIHKASSRRKKTSARCKTESTNAGLIPEQIARLLVAGDKDAEIQAMLNAHIDEVNKTESPAATTPGHLEHATRIQDWSNQTLSSDSSSLPPPLTYDDIFLTKDFFFNSVLTPPEKEWLPGTAAILQPASGMFSPIPPSVDDFNCFIDELFTSESPVNAVANA